jgi:ABC-type Fe3+ transport system permease subunit
LENFIIIVIIIIIVVVKLRGERKGLSTYYPPPYQTGLKIVVYISQEQFSRAGAALAILVAIPVLFMCVQKHKRRKTQKSNITHTQRQKRNNKENAQAKTHFLVSS